MTDPIASTIQKVETMARCARIIVDTQENLTPAQLSELFGLHEKVGYFFFFSDEKNMKIDEEKLPPIQVEEGEKTPSKRLRDRLFVYYMNKLKKPPHDFNDWYTRELERIGNKYLETIR